MNLLLGNQFDRYYDYYDVIWDSGLDGLRGANFDAWRAYVRYRANTDIDH